jgi:RNA ligase (TIGR02306 family)
MSTIRVPIVPITQIRPHSSPEVERLEVAVVEGWQLVVLKGQFQEGELVVYFEQGTVISRELADSFGVTTYLSEKTDINGDRVLVIHRVRLKGEASFGLAMPLPDDCVGLPVNLDLAGYFGATKFMPPIKAVISDAEPAHPAFPTYTDIENLRSYPHKFMEGEWVVMTEKLHGSSGRACFVRDDETDDMKILAGSRTLQRKSPIEGEYTPEEYARIIGSNVYWSPMVAPGVADMLYWLYKAGHQQAAIYGEVYGSKIQSYDYGEKRLGFRAFDIMIDGKYLPYTEFESLCAQYGIERVPTLYVGPYSFETIAAHSNGDSLVGGSHGREGGVVRPVYAERHDASIGRVILKFVGDDYLFSRAAMKNDTTDV